MEMMTFESTGSILTQEAMLSWFRPFALLTFSGRKVLIGDYLFDGVVSDGCSLLAASSELKLFDLSSKKRICKFAGHAVGFTCLLRPFTEKK